MSLRINNSNISQMKINGVNIQLAKINGSIVFEINGEIITLSFNDKTISAISNKSGSYDFYYAKDGEIIEEYDKIVSFDLVADIESSYTYLNSFNIAPYDATEIVVCKSGTSKVLSSSSLPSQLLFDSKTYGDKLYSVGLISDTHIDGDGTDTADSINDFKKALALFSNESVSFIAHCGDVTENNRDSDYTAYSNIVVDNTIPIKTIAGNHDSYSTLQSITGNSLYYEYSPSGTNDIYLFLGSYQASTTDPFSNEELTWLETKLEEHKNKRVFLFLHYYCEPVGNANNLDSDNLETTGQAATFRKLMATYKDNVIYFSGHSHLTYKLQEEVTTANINLATDTLPKRVHIPSTGRPRILSDGSITNEYVGSECAIMDVYENCIVIRGKDLTDNKFLPIANYCLDTTLIISDEEEEIINLLPNFSKTSELNSGVTASFTGEDTNITLDGTATSSYNRTSWKFNLSLEQGKNYIFKAEILSGAVDASNHDNEIGDVILRGYTDASNYDLLVDETWYTTDGNEKNTQFSISSVYTNYCLVLKQKSRNIYDNLVVKFTLIEKK